MKLYEIQRMDALDANYENSIEKKYLHHFNGKKITFIDNIDNYNLIKTSSKLWNDIIFLAVYRSK